MRDPARIDVICDKLAEVWKLTPDLRLCQLLQNVNKANNMFYIEDDITLDNLKKWQDALSKNLTVK